MSAITSDNTLPLSCSTGLSRDVLVHLKRMQLTGRAWDVCAHFHDLSFGNAGWRRKKGESEISCTFDLASWATALHMDRSNLQRLLGRLKDHHILTIEPLDQPGRATLTWNVNFHEWLPGYDTHRSPQQARNLGCYSQKKPSELSTVAHLTVPSQLRLPAKNSTIRTKHDSLDSAITTKHACLDAVTGVLPPALNKSTEEEYTEEETYLAAHAAQGNLFPAVLARKQETKPPAQRVYPHQDFFDVMQNALGHGPEGGEWEKWATGCKRLKKCQVDTQELQDLCIAFIRRWPDANCNPQSIYGNLGELRHDVKKKNGAIRYASQAEPLGIVEL